MIVRPFKKSDAVACCNLINSCLSASKDMDNPSRFSAMAKNIPTEFYAEIKDDIALVAELHGTLVGFGALHDEMLHHIYVSPDFQGNGIGETLVLGLEAEAKANGYTVVYLDASPNVIDFFKRMGYKVDTKTKKQMQDKIVKSTRMRKKLPISASV